MNKNIKNIIFVCVLLLLNNCSFDNKTGIWRGDKDEKARIAELERRQNLEIYKVYSSDEPYNEEIVATNHITLSEAENNTSWKMPGKNLQNYLGNIYLSGIEKVILKKKIGKNKFSLSGTRASPVIYKNNIIFSDDVGTIFNITKTGKLKWKINIYKKIYKKIYKNLSLSIFNDTIYIADNIGFIYALNLNTGELTWIKNHGIPFKSNLKIFENKIFVINQDNRLLCYNTEDGSLAWDIRSTQTFIKLQNFLSLAVSKKGNLVVLDSSGNLFKVRAKSGRMYWSLDIAATELAANTDFFKSSDVVLTDNEIIFSAFSSIFSINLDSGYINWKNEISSKNNPIVDGNNVFIVSDNGYFVNINRKSGKIVWSTNILKILKEKKQKTQTTGLIIGSGKFYVTTLNGYLIVGSASSGKVEYSKKIGEKITTSPIIIDGSLFILTEKSRILAFS